ncbi:FG-GAP repeat domain-containing protein [Tumebacillus permanentifrigoris]|uniref:VCBS repeat protein n=1 Tax=Tumebacillus permanentifrigoris TaxID=378543 RepID=A0A316D6P4_9BACL|nr:VCBS repeat-containing protein [Tumebacillus permanentifrigoris]PWK09647.1 VCBS repeat protein [Tumebacillus permanentifrigoris]
MKRKFLILTLILTLVGSVTVYSTVHSEVAQLQAMVLYEQGTTGYLDAYQDLKQSLVANLQTESVTMQEVARKDLSHYRVIYVDPSILQDSKRGAVVNQLTEYVRAGGCLFIEDGVREAFPAELLGAREFREVQSLPLELEFPVVRQNLRGMQAVVQDFHEQWKGFRDVVQGKPTAQQSKVESDAFRTSSANGGAGSTSKAVAAAGYGFGMVPSTAEPLVNSQGLALFTVNRVGAGSVFFANALLPNHRYGAGFDLQGKPYFNFTVATANFLLRNEFAAYAAKEQDGLVVKKVLGTYGRPAVAFQNHFEVASAVRDGAMEKYLELVKKYEEIPSYSLARSLYEWAHWTESVIYHLNTGTGSAPKYIGEEADSQYASGRHPLVESKYLTLNPLPEQRYLAEAVDLPNRAYPSVADVNGDQVPDLVAGSADGAVYVFQGRSAQVPWQLMKSVKLQTTAGRDISAGRDAAPVLCDLNKDGQVDLIVGNAEGEVVAYLNAGNMKFSSPRVLIPQSAGLREAAPDIGDVDHDGAADLVVGDAEGRVLLFKAIADTGSEGAISRPTGASAKGQANAVGAASQPDARVWVRFSKGIPIAGDVGKFAAPRLVDFDGDGQLDLVVGNDYGYLQKFRHTSTGWVDAGYVEGETYNPFGNKRLWSGHNAVPCYADLNGDGKPDLIVGQVEHGMATPIDSPAFPYRNELKRSLTAMQEAGIEIQPHLFFHNFKSAEQERTEIDLHRRAFAMYSLPWDHVGANQHTWRINQLDPAQTLFSQQAGGIAWNSGFKPANHPVTPSEGREYAWSVPFFLAQGEQTQPMLLFNPAPNPTAHAAVYPSIARHDLPVSVFQHVEYPVLQEAGRKELEQTAQFVDKFRTDNDYNFMTEEQMFRTFRTVLGSRVELVPASSGTQFNLRVTPPADAKWLGDYLKVLGVKVELGEKFAGQQVQTDADLYMRKGNDLYMGVWQKATFTIVPTAAAETPHLTRANVPIEVQTEGNRITLDVLGKALQQMKFYAPNGLQVDSAGWAVKQAGEQYVLTRYGDVTQLRVQYK